jgi:hypothetical protein
MACPTPTGTPISPIVRVFIYCALVCTQKGWTCENFDRPAGLAAQDAAGEHVTEELRPLHLGV